MAIWPMIGGGNPYGVGYSVSRPAGAAFPYGPVALLWYLPFRIDPRAMELWSRSPCSADFGIRAAKGRPIGLPIFALAPPLVLASMDGSNDTSAGLFILGAIAVAVRVADRRGASILAVAVAFKPYAVAFLPGFVVWAGLTRSIAFVGDVRSSRGRRCSSRGASIRTCAASRWPRGPTSGTRTGRSQPWSTDRPGLDARVLETLRYFAAGAVGVFGALRVRSMDGVIVVGSLAFVIAQFGGYFGSYVYIAAIAPVLCWRVDDWLQMGLPELMRTDGTAGSGRTLRRAVHAPAPVHAPTPVLAPVPVRSASSSGRVMSAVRRAARGPRHPAIPNSVRARSRPSD